MKIIIILFIALLFSFPVNAAEKFLNIQEVTSDSGLTAWLVEDHSLPIIAIQFSFLDAGAKNDPANKQGRAKLLSNMLDEGAGELDSQAFQKQLNDHSISLSFSNGRDHFNGNLKTLSRHKEKAFNLLRLALNSPRFDAEPLERMKQANISRIKSSLTNPNWIAARLQNDLVFNDHPYALNSGGTISSLTQLSSNDLKEFKDTFLKKDRLAVGITGDITIEEVKVFLDQVFNDLPSDKGSHQTKKSSPTPKLGHYLYEKDIPQTIVDINFPSFSRQDPDFYAALVFNHILGGGGFGSRLMEKAREDEGLTYGIYSSLSFLDEAQGFSISTSTQSDKVERMMQIIESEIALIKQDGVSEKELTDAKSYITGSLPLSLTSTSKIAGILASLQKNDRSIDYLDNYKKNIETVNANDIKRVASRILNEEKMTALFVGPHAPTTNINKLEALPNVE
ncbi:MAG: insulinase family protein [Alphaproteobacteria bacterium]|nr:insulinase family protein [Alphaproteobacteria bacterium]